MPHVPAMLLAAGKSSRMGCCKQLLPLGDRPVIVHCLSSIVSAGIAEIIVVLGAHHEQLADLLRGYPLTVAQNFAPDSDMASSVRAGMEALSPHTTGVLVCPTDHPLVASETYRSLLDRHRQEPHKILIPTHGGERGHPALFPVALLKELAMLPTLRDVARREPERVLLVETTDKGVLLDMDTPEDYQKLASFYQSL